MTWIGRTFLWTVFACQFSVTTCFAQVQEDDPDERAAQCAIFGTLLSNASAMQSCDVLLLDRAFYDAVREVPVGNDAPGNGVAPEKKKVGITLRETTYRRLRFDSGRKRFLALSRTTREWLDLDQITDEFDGRIVQSEDLGRLIDVRAGEAWKTTAEGLLTALPYPTVGFLPFEDPRTMDILSDGHPLDEAVELMQGFLTGDRLVACRNSPDGVELTVVARTFENMKVREMAKISFDPETSLPRTLMTYLESPNGKRSAPNMAWNEWEEIASIYVPVSYIADRPDSFIRPNRRPETGFAKREICFHWFSVNEPIPAEELEREVLLDKKKFADLVDPVRSDATRILKLLASEQAGPPERVDDK